jgi:hypothetical protein
VAYTPQLVSERESHLFIGQGGFLFFFEVKNDKKEAIT